MTTERNVIISNRVVRIIKDILNDVLDLKNASRCLVHKLVSM